MAIAGEKRKKKKAANMSCCEPFDKNERWEIERDLDALCRAKAVQADPERMKKCQKMAAEKLDESKRKKEEAQNLIDMGNMA